LNTHWLLHDHAIIVVLVLTTFRSRTRGTEEAAEQDTADHTHEATNHDSSHCAAIHVTAVIRRLGNTMAFFILAGNTGCLFLRCPTTALLRERSTRLLPAPMLPRECRTIAAAYIAAALA
jgi:hypothetical protein